MSTNATATRIEEATAARYEIDAAHAHAAFKVRHLMVASVRGELGVVTGQATIDDADLARSSVVASIDARGLDTRNADRDQHLRSADFLDVDRFPSIDFRSTRIVAGADDTLQVTGELTIRGVTREVTLATELSAEVRDPWGNAKRGVSATARVSRKDFGITWNLAMDGGGLVVGDAIDIAIELELVRKR